MKWIKTVLMVCLPLVFSGMALGDEKKGFWPFDRNEVKAQKITLSEPDGKVSLFLRADGGVVGVWIVHGSREVPVFKAHEGEDGALCLDILEVGSKAVPRCSCPGGGQCSCRDGKGCQGKMCRCGMKCKCKAACACPTGGKCNCRDGNGCKGGKCRCSVRCKCKMRKR